jgi:hypothetical protein
MGLLLFACHLNKTSVGKKMSGHIVDFGELVVHEKNDTSLIASMILIITMADFSHQNK